MDCTPIFEPEFDMKAWLNAAFAAGATEEGLDDADTANRLLAKLQSYQQEVGSLLEESWTAAVSAVPRAAREIASVKQEALLLQDQLRSVKSQLERVEQETSASMSKLVQSDQLKGRLQRARAALREADNWTTLSGNIDELLDSSDLTATGERLAQLAQSLSMLDSSPDYAARRQQLESWRNQFEAQLAVHVYRAFAVRDTAECARLVGLLARIDRPAAANAHYQRWLTGHLAETWAAAVAAEVAGDGVPDGESATSSADVAESALDALLDVCRRELRAALLPDCQSLVLACLARSLPALRPPLPEVMRPPASRGASASDDLHACLRRIALLCRCATELSALFHDHHHQQQQPLLEALSALLRPAGPALLTDLETSGAEQLSRDLAAIPMDQSEVDDTLSLLENATPLALAAARRLLTACATTAPLSLPRLSRLLPTHLTRFLAELGRVLGNVRAKLPDPAEDWTAVSCVLRCGCLLGRLVDQATEFTDEFPDLVDAGAFANSADWAPEIYSSETPEGDSDKRLLRDLTACLADGRPPGWVRELRVACQEFCRQEHKHLFALLTRPVDRLLGALPTLPCWAPSSNPAAQQLPAFGYLASDCVAQVGQYLLHLPQQLGPFLSADTPGLRTAVTHSGLMQILLHHRQSHAQGGSGEQATIAGAELWIECVASHAMDRYVDRALDIAQLTTQSAVQQLLTDANYLASCLDDLGVSPSDRLQALRDLVATPDAEAFHRRAAEGAPRRLVASVARMRDLGAGAAV